MAHLPSSPGEYGCRVCLRDDLVGMLRVWEEGKTETKLLLVKLSVTLPNVVGTGSLAPIARVAMLNCQGGTPGPGVLMTAGVAVVLTC
jgi:hypothetical protein